MRQGLAPHPSGHRGPPPRPELLGPTAGDDHPDPRFAGNSMNAVPPIISSRLPQDVSSITARPVTLALQGGGALGAFSWGVLDRLLDEPRLRITAISGASAGAMNAAMLVQGLAAGGPAEAKRLLEALWRRVAVAAGSPDLDGVDWLCPFTGIFSPMTGALRQATATALPPAPLGQNPLRGVLE